MERVIEVKLTNEKEYRVLIDHMNKIGWHRPWPANPTGVDIDDYHINHLKKGGYIVTSYSSPIFQSCMDTNETYTSLSKVTELISFDDFMKMVDNKPQDGKQIKNTIAPSRYTMKYGIQPE